CEKILGGKEGRVCDGCRKKLPYIREPRCMSCGKVLKREEQEYCQSCEKGLHSFDQGISTFLYEKKLRHSIHRMKFQNRREYLDFYAEEMVRESRRYLLAWKPDVLIPIPMYRRKEKARGYNQSRLLAEKIGRLTGIEVDCKSVIRCRETLPQKELTAQERKKNLKGAFQITAPEQIKKRILLIDDIYTTGATVDAVSSLLKKHGAGPVYFLTICSGNGK
ncbi:MAG: ComF family protein, partial [Lachnospiraceae bacterium]|nr:ComF family protein [Lachnospiraceae bacterium]